ncbi:MAG: tetraacyldisaccharide 4'-kinase [Hydrogenophaga sp.]|uniref:tetraacyldisaccharide 4'-kinase n=1 Tax=Hydrogenophaga sp. TaxID=1904254 RepID=UPI0016A48A02|nr:tetraacyldisaccharide 4'-kinase [Hydrogenophaga sp.]NIM41097.1 tetraacyldisaccharide 4'-kinase [Hydrogenophaga sp.]NIN26413.1 tetraacyldisaccharide 4'-kinase [Hydrogenophaga sp.]NIN31288.1 tetraacyldisaccharide 4'-kinase [Hydrogenophaga sp.]NIN55343.1 tetraacyldisaccharide 4'-kinase [Hydrogenophaga sp.]NIO51678.1 tetraacyldisaccharide 4'-kinase [Hydrogenophaga sp.]
MARARVEACWRALSLRRGLAARLLLPLAWLYGALLAARRTAYQSGRRQATHLPVPVVVVGNVVVGGAGKTPTTIALVEHLKARGWRPGVVSRGHGRTDASPRAVHTDTDPAQAGDEPLLICRASGVPVWVGRSRADAAAALLRAHPDVNLIVCDDGLQHWSLASDLRVAVFDERGLGNGWLLPAGLLREPWPCADAPRAPQLVLQQAPEGAPPPAALPGHLPSFLARRSLAAHAVNAQGERVALASLADQPVTALAGIARPDAFFGMLRGRGLRLAASVALGDHADAHTLAQAVDRATGPVLCTEKDLVKFAGTPRPNLWAVPLVLDIDPAFFAAVDERLGPPRA